MRLEKFDFAPLIIKVLILSHKFSRSSMDLWPITTATIIKTFIYFFFLFFFFSFINMFYVSMIFTVHVRFFSASSSDFPSYISFIFTPTENVPQLLNPKNAFTLKNAFKK